MRFITGIASVLAVTAGLVSSSPISEEIAAITRTPAEWNALALEALQEQEKTIQRRDGACTLENARVRRDWSKLSKCERKSYIKAVKCLWKLPAVDKKFSAAQNYYDEFVAIHANQTDQIHGTGNFFTWHRYLIQLWEDTLIDKCHYKGSLPYWNWFEYQDDLSKSPMFDGSMTSFGSTGEYFAHNGSLVGNRQIWLPSGKGGGCIKDGPFVDFTINIGPIRPAMDNYLPWMTNQLDYNPRCQRRDLVTAASMRYTLESLYDLLAGPLSSTIGDFQDNFQAVGTLSLHGAGHYAMGGDGSDVFTSLNDPAFYQHHAMVDRMYWMWQALHPKVANTVAGYTQRLNDPPSPKTTENDILNLGVLGPHLRIKDLYNTLGGPLCYIYE